MPCPPIKRDAPLPLCAQVQALSTSGPSSAATSTGAFSAEAALARSAALASASTSTSGRGSSSVWGGFLGGSGGASVGGGSRHQMPLLTAVRHVVRTEGVCSLWKGNLATILHRLPYSAVNFATFDMVSVYWGCMCVCTGGRMGMVW